VLFDFDYNHAQIMLKTKHNQLKISGNMRSIRRFRATFFTFLD